MTGVPGGYPHDLLHVSDWLATSEQGFFSGFVYAGTTVSPRPLANVVHSRISGTDDRHTIMLDLDLSAALFPSSTPGHFHLYIDKVMPWRKYKRLLKALAKAGVIEHGYYKASVGRRGTCLRLPGVSK